ncbi:MAG: NADH-quinone oxidoreductase subunit NuoE [Dehalococcoidales bacterium]|nr:NADH-quinone oxidoreductase subunit NuoE [Dehalococcoidales bacterium]
MMVEAKTKPQNETVLVRLKEVQDKLGYIPEESIKAIAQSTGVPVSQVYGVATFYSFLTVKPKGRNIIRICQCEPCHIKDSKVIIAALEDALGVDPGETTADGRFTLEFTNCIGACDMAPAMLINDDLLGNLTPGKIPQILQLYK